MKTNSEMVNSGVDWLGEIPSHWELRRARYMFRQSTSKGNDRLVLLSATQDRGVVDKSTLDSVVQVAADADLSLFKTVHKNDFVISLRSFQGGFEISHEEGVISPAYTVFRLTQQEYPHYYRYLFKSYGFIDKINSLTVGIREGKNIQYVDFSNMLLPYFALEEQQKIAEFLDRKCAEVDEMIALQEQIIEELKAYKQSVITEAVTKGLNPDVPMKDSGIEWIGQIPEHWEVRRIKYLLNERKERSVDGSEEPLSMSQKYGLIPTKEMDVIPNMASTFEGAKIVYTNDLVFNKLKAHLGVFATSEYNGLVSPDYAVYYGVGRALMPFMEYMFKTPQYISEFRKTATGVGSGLTRLYTSDLFAMLFPLPSIQEQEEIVSHIKKKCGEIDELIAIKQSKIDSLKEYKKSIIYEYVTGKREVE